MMQTAIRRQQLEQTRARLERVVSLLDDRWRIPGTRIRFGLDALIGLVPVAGDVAGALLSFWIVAEALRLRAPRALVGRMLSNVLIELGAGAVPLLGDVFDLLWKANRRNFELLHGHLDRELHGGLPPRSPVPRWLWFASGLLALLLLLLVLEGLS